MSPALCYQIYQSQSLLWTATDIASADTCSTTWNKDSKPCDTRSPVLQGLPDTGVWKGAPEQLLWLLQLGPPVVAVTPQLVLLSRGLPAAAAAAHPACTDPNKNHRTARLKAPDNLPVGCSGLLPYLHAAAAA